MKEDVEHWRNYRQLAASRHTTHYLSRAEEFQRPTPMDYDALEHLRVNVLAAVERAYQMKQWSHLLRFARVLTNDGAHGFLLVRGYWKELRIVLERAIQSSKAEGNNYDTATFFHDLALLEENTGKYDDARCFYQQSLDLKEVLGDLPGIARTLHQLGIVAHYVGNYDEAQSLYERSLKIVESSNDQQGIAYTLHQLGVLVFLVN